ncbi:MAG: hypothetical protein KIT84_00580 [Labilithrix sp.]|nr:hypothetical protein [Labilithrix sp.]MCW5809479.1 hypothetical protein [Labilithrix sp.]
MIPFLSTVTPRGAERVRRLRDAETREELDTLIKEMVKDLSAELAGNRTFTAADEYAFQLALGLRTAELPRAAASSFDVAAQIALSAGAHQEGLFALEKAEEARPSPDRAKRIKALRQALRPAETRAEAASSPSSRRVRRLERA